MGLFKKEVKIEEIKNETKTKKVNKYSNITEEKGYKYLLSKGYSETDIVFQRRDSPDFLTADNKGFDVKRKYGNVIWFSESQFLKIKSLDNIEILVFNDESNLPITKFSSKELEPNKIINGIKITVNFDKKSLGIDVDEDTHKSLKKIQTNIYENRNINYDFKEIIRLLVIDPKKSEELIIGNLSI